MLMTKYGQPDIVSDRVLIWHDKAHRFLMAHTDFMTQTVMYRAPWDKLDELAAYDGSVWYHRTRGELSAQCDLEELNNLALNLAHDVATGTRTVDDARGFVLVEGAKRRLSRIDEVIDEEADFPAAGVDSRRAHRLPG